VRTGADLDTLRDEDEATHRYTETWCKGGESVPLGLENAPIVLFGATVNRWVAIAPPGAETPIVICPPGPAVTAALHGSKRIRMTPLRACDVDSPTAESLAGRVSRPRAFPGSDERGDKDGTASRAFRGRW
jgi:hypothetical protein